MEIKDRIKQIRTKNNLIQEELENKIGAVSKAHISSLKDGTINVTDRIINDIYCEFNVDENWLHTGESDIYVKTIDNELEALVQKQISLLISKEEIDAIHEIVTYST